jgi:hypothetical protein
MKKFILLSTICLICLTGKISAQTTGITTTNSSTNYTQAGVDLYDAHNYKDAIVQLNNAIKENPKDGKAFYYRGMAKMHDKQKGFCKDLEESLDLGYSTRSDIYYYGCETLDKKKN